MKKLSFAILISVLFFGHTIPLFAATSFTIGTWVAYWSNETGIRAATDRISSFDEISPLVFEVNPDFTISDKTDQSETYWQELYAKARTENVRLVPTVLWGDKDQIHAMLSNPEKRTAHIAAILQTIQDFGAAGIDIDYEGKYKDDKPLFSQFISELGAALHAKNQILTCTIEARTTDAPAKSAPEKTLMAWANNYIVLGEACDQVRVMAYDHYYLTRGAQTWRQTTKNLGGLQADYDWTKQVITYALKYIPKQKLILGIPTYGYEFEYKDRTVTREFTRVQTVSYEKAIAIAGAHNKKLQRFSGGEQYFTYTKNGTKRIVILEDATIINKKIEYARSKLIAGVYLFKVEGTEDIHIWDTLKSR